MVFLIHHIRKIILTFSFFLGIGIYIFVSQQIKSPTLELIRLAEYYALTATIFLYLAVLASPLYSVFPNLPFKPIYIRARRAIGVSAFFFALTHATIAFFGLLGGFEGLQFLENNYLIAISCSFTALLILSLMAATSFDFMVKKLGTKWKTLHRFVYLAVLLITIHALMLGTHFAVLTNLIPKLYFAALAFLLILESIRFDRYLTKRFNLNFNFGLSLVVIVALITFGANYLVPTSVSKTNNLGVHATHVQLAEQASQSQTTQLPNLPGLNGDRTKRYTLSLSQPDSITAGEEVELKFKVYDAANGSPVTLFQKPYEKTFHLIVVDQDLKYFAHLHPTQTGSEFKITTSFSSNSVYHLYSDFQPVGAIDQQIGTTIKVGQVDSTQEKSSVDKDLTKTFGDYQVTLNTNGALKASDMTLGKQKLSFTIKDTQTGQPITNLKPYLASFGHLVMINQETFDYLHVHPYNLTPPAADANGGPTVDFLPIGIYGPFKAGVYRVFAQFNPDNKLFVADFTVKVN